MSYRGRISTVIIAQNEEHRLGRCVEACLPFSDEVLVVDGGSDDGTRELARRLGCRVVENEWPGYSAQRNFGARAATHDWIFSVDADEIVDTDLRGALNDLRESGFGDRRAYAIRRVNNFLGAWLTESPERKVRLYDRRRAGFTDEIVHEEVNVPPRRVPVLSGRIWHADHATLRGLTRNLNYYTSLEVDWTGHTRMRAWRLVFRPPLRFLQRYLLQRSFRHGWRGLFYACHWAYWELLREMKVYERSRISRHGSG